MNQHVELSIIVPAFREGPDLSMAIGQIRACALTATSSIEIIIVDDGSETLPERAFRASPSDSATCAASASAGTTGRTPPSQPA